MRDKQERVSTGTDRDQASTDALEDLDREITRRVREAQNAQEASRWSGPSAEPEAVVPDAPTNRFSREHFASLDEIDAGIERKQNELSAGRSTAAVGSSTAVRIDVAPEVEPEEVAEVAEDPIVEAEPIAPEPTEAKAPDPEPEVEAPEAPEPEAEAEEEAEPEPEPESEAAAEPEAEAEAPSADEATTAETEAVGSDDATAQPDEKAETPKSPAKPRGRASMRRRRVLAGTALAIVAIGAGLGVAALTNSDSAPKATRGRTQGSDYTATLSQTIRALVAKRDAGISALRSADTQAAEATAARGLAQAHTVAAAKLSQADVQAAQAASRASTVASLRAVAAAYTQLARAASGGDSAAYATARDRIDTAESALRDSLQAS